MDEIEIMSIIESILFVSGDYVSLDEISEALDMSKDKISDIMANMIKRFDNSSRGIKIVQINDKYQFVTRPRHSDYVQMFVESRRRDRLSQAALETLAIIAHRQPITRMDIEDIRGVQCGGIIANLLDKGFIEVVSRLDAPGRPMLYGTTDLFLEHFGLKTIEELSLLKTDKDV